MGDSAANDYPLPHASTDLTGQVALVTGASAGLGRRFALTLAAAGARVVATARRADRLKELADEIKATGGGCEPFALDVTDADACEAALDHAEAIFGAPVTILVNNAGIPDAQRAHKLSIDMIDKVIATNVRGPFVLSCAMARRLIKAELPGRIVNLSSMAAFNYTGNAAALYSTTKAAINRMTETLAVEWVRYGINVNGIAPGSFDSEMHRGMVERIGDFSHRLPRKRVGDPAQLDSSLLYLVGPASEAVTGTVLKVDDGQFPR